MKATLRWMRDRLPRGDAVIHLYCLCWNEERMLPFFFRHYDPLVARYFVFDNGSTDRSLSILAAHPKVTLDEFHAAHGSLIGEARAFYETVWHRSRGIADWVLIINIDEHLYHPDGLAYFWRCSREGATAIVTTGYEMAAESFPEPGQTLSHSIIRGVRAEYMDKLCAFRPHAITKLRYEVGRHKARPKGHVVYPRGSDLKLLHYKFLDASYVVDRYAELRERISDADRERSWGTHYFQEPEAIAAAHRAILTAARPVPGLSGGLVKGD